MIKSDDFIGWQILHRSSDILCILQSSQLMSRLIRFGIPWTLSLPWRQRPTRLPVVTLVAHGRSNPASQERCRPTVFWYCCFEGLPVGKITCATIFRSLRGVTLENGLANQITGQVSWWYLLAVWVFSVDLHGSKSHSMPWCFWLGNGNGKSLHPTKEPIVVVVATCESAVFCILYH